MASASDRKNWDQLSKMAIDPNDARLDASIATNSLASRERNEPREGREREPCGIPLYRCYKTLLTWSNRHKLNLCPMKQERTPAKQL